MRSVGEHWFWWLLTMACLIWYILVTGYVAVRGAFDIKNMLRRLADKATSEYVKTL